MKVNKGKSEKEKKAYGSDQEAIGQVDVSWGNVESSF